MKDNQAFLKAYAMLDSAQKVAVDTVEGPVLVIAGPGTGKTHILTLRIANILKETQANATNILVLTFTDSAARTVRERVANLIGEETARDVFISTFHGFANHVLEQYADFFPAWAGKRQAGNIESTLLWREVLETEELVHLRTPKSPFFYLRDLARLRDDLARERISLDSYRTFAKEEEERIRNDESNYYARDSKYGKKGDLKPDGQKKIDRLEKIYEAARLIEAYDKLKDERDLYDFTDVLRIVTDRLAEDEALRTTLQEQYQYVLADEHQDANALQHALLDALAYDEHPNLFVVGDEKQAIFRFQGADASHFGEFLERYPRTVVVELETSYRSLAPILTAAHGLTAGMSASRGEHKTLSAHRSEGTSSLDLLIADDPLAERDQVSGLVEDAIKNGTRPEEIAVITRTNANADHFADHLAARGISTLRAGDVSLSSRPVIRSLQALMKAVADPLDVPALRESLLAPWWEASLPERALFLRETRDFELAAKLEERFPQIAETVRTLQESAQRLAPLELVSNLLAKSGARGFLLSHTEHLDDVLLIRRLIMHIEELVRRDANISFASVIDELRKAEEHGLESVKASVLQKDGFVTVITAHKAKGMEFERVFLVSATSREWEKGGRAATIPSPISQQKQAEDAVRLFYVALTRAKDALIISYANETGDGKDQAPSSLIPEGLNLIAPDADLLPLTHSTIDASELICDLTRNYLTHDGLSPSALNEYLESPASFFAKRVLRLREPEMPALTVGTAVHAGIAAFLETKEEDKAYAALEGTMRRSLLPRNAAFDRISEHARASLAAYIRHRDEPGTLLAPSAIEKTYETTRTIDGCTIKLKGQIDALFETSSGICIADFKTTSEIKAVDEKYVRQLAFYDLLVRENAGNATSASIVQVGPDGVKNHEVPLTTESRAELATVLDEVLGELLSGKWREGIASEYDDLLKLFT
ncbi:MAG: ATP-dependent DNA helicase [Patescibacteria group bacterium]